MSFFRKLNASFLFCCGAAIVCAGRPVAADAQQTAAAVPADAPYKQATLPVEDRVRDLLGRMTVEEKARQLDMYRGVSPSIKDDAQKAADEIKAHGFQPAEAEKAWGTLGVGSIHDLYGPPTLNNDIQTWVMKNTRLGIPALFAEEGLHGFSTGTIFPAPVNLAATWDRQVARETGAAIAAEARATGVDMLFAPVLDLAREPRWGRVEEDFGEDPYLTGQLGLQYVEGFQGDSLASDHTVIAEPKHFAGHGSPESGTNTSPAHYGERELRSVMLKSFEPAFREGHAMATMAAYHEIDGIPVTADSFLLKTILRGEWGFKGFVLSDLGAIERLSGAHRVAATPKDAVVLAINSGVDMQFYDFDHATFQNAIIDGIHDGSLSPAALDRAVSDVLRVKFELGLFDHPLVDPSLNASVHRAQAHLDLSRQSALESMTLLKNEGHLLPLSKSLKRITVIGPNARIARYGDYAPKPDPAAHNDLFSALHAMVPNAELSFADGKDIPAAVAKTKDAEVVILALGERQGISGEGFDRSNLDLPDNQEALLEAVVATGKPTVLVLQNGRPLTIAWAAQHVPAILEAWYPGEFGGQAMVMTLFGDNNPGGHLTVTFPRSVGVLPDYYNYDPSKNHRYVDGDDTPVFPFGFGLSYTSFRFDGLRIEAPALGKGAVTATVNVTNTGKVAGDEVAQLYIRQDVSSVETPERALKGFVRVRLEPGQTKAVTFEVPQSELALWNAEKTWVVEPGAYTAWVGDSSQAALTGKFLLQAGTGGTR
ncbi:MAG TPA: glycoside hydrolase family 3 N-terminal domain-containing protein [Terracidiphilus sp.]